MIEEQPQERQFCGAKTRTGGTCKHPPTAGKTRCRLHGGLTPVGAASPHWKHGRHSRYAKLFGAELGAMYRTIREDEDALSVGPEVGVIQLRIEQAVARLQCRDSSALWRELSEAMTDLDAARRSGNSEALASPLTRIQGLITEGATAESQWREVVDLIERKAKVASAEWKRLHDMHETMTANQAITLVSALCSIFLDALKVMEQNGCAPELVKQARRKVTHEITALANANPRLDSRPSPGQNQNAEE
jgi:hypothetical protein